jgi:hypothetical protein
MSQTGFDWLDEVLESLDARRWAEAAFEQE